MTTQFEVDLPAPIPGAGPSSREGLIIAVPFAAVTTNLKVLGGDAILAGWILRETTGLAGAIVELFDGADTTGVLVGSFGMSAGSDISASQSAQAATASGANAQQVATITPGAGVTAFLQSFRITGLGATAASTVTATLTGVQGGTINYPVSVPAGVTVPITPVTDTFGTTGLQASGPATAISLTLPAFGAGNTLESAEIVGYFRNQIGFGDRQWFGAGGLYLRSGLFMNVLSGSVKGTFFIRS